MSHVTCKWVTYERVMSRKIRHVTWKWVISRINESCHKWTSHVTYERVMSHMNVFCSIWRGVEVLWSADMCWHVLTCVDMCWRVLTYERVLQHLTWSRIFESAVMCWHILTCADMCWHVMLTCTLGWSLRQEVSQRASQSCQTSQMNESWHIWMSHVTHERVLPRMNTGWLRMKQCLNVWMSHGTYEWLTSHTNESCHTWIRPVTHYRMCAAWSSVSTYEWVTPHMNESCHIWMSQVTHDYRMVAAWSNASMRSSARSTMRTTCDISTPRDSSSTTQKRIITVFYKFVVLNKSYTWYLNASLQLYYYTNKEL